MSFVSSSTPESLVTLEKLPREVWTSIFAYLPSDGTSVKAFSNACRDFYYISKDPHARAEYFSTKYGSKLALCESFRSHRHALTVDCARLLRKRGTPLPRFLIQWVDKEYHRTDRGKKAVPVPLYVFFIHEGYALYGHDADYREDDFVKFERLLYSGASAAIADPSTSVTTQAGIIQAMKVLIHQYGFFPLRGLGTAVDEAIFLLSNLDITLVPKLIDNGLDMAGVNDLVLERVLWSAELTEASLNKYLMNGFTLTSKAICKGLQTARESTYQVLRTKVSEETLKTCAYDTLVGMFGPSSAPPHRGWTWTPEAVNYLMETFNIPDTVVHRALYSHPDSPTNPSTGAHLSFPATRPYMKANPCPVWRWVLQTYGPEHEFTRACFDDAISRASGDRELHALHDEYLEEGVRFYPRHVKILACRVLHRDMTENALHLMRCLREMVVRLVAMGEDDEAVRDEWIRLLKDEIVDSQEWNHRMRTTQLEGGARGGAYRISKPPEDALRFLEESSELVEELLILARAPPGDGPSSSSRLFAANGEAGNVVWAVRGGLEGEGVGDRRSGPGMKYWVKRVGIWWSHFGDKGTWSPAEGMSSSL